MRNQQYPYQQSIPQYQTPLNLNYQYTPNQSYHPRIVPGQAVSQIINYPPPQTHQIQSPQQNYYYPTLGQEQPLINPISTTQLYQPYQNFEKYQPQPIFFQPEDGFYEQNGLKSNLQRPFTVERPEIPLVSTQYSKGYSDGYIPLDDQFEKFKNKLYSNDYYTYSQMVDNTVNCIQEQILTYREIDKLKQKLVERPDLELDVIYFMMTDNNKFLSADDWFESLRKWKMDIKKSDVELLTNFIGSQYNDFNKITIEEFKSIFYVEGIPKKKVSIKEKSEISEHTIELIKRLFSMLLQAESQMEYSRQKFEKKLTNYSYVFDMIDKNRQGFIDELTLRQIFKDRDFFINLIDAKHIIDRFDKNGDGVIDLNEFVREFRHKSKAIYLESALEGKKI